MSIYWLTKFYFHLASFGFMYKPALKETKQVAWLPEGKEEQKKNALNKKKQQKVNNK